MKATWKGKTIAESDTILEVHGYQYFPRDAVRMDLLKKAGKPRAISNVRTACSSTTSPIVRESLSVPPGPTRSPPTKP